MPIISATPTPHGAITIWQLRERHAVCPDRPHAAGFEHVLARVVWRLGRIEVGFSTNRSLASRISLVRQGRGGRSWKFHCPELNFSCTFETKLRAAFPGGAVPDRLSVIV